MVPRLRDKISEWPVNKATCSTLDSEVKQRRATQIFPISGYHKVANYHLLWLTTGLLGLKLLVFGTPSTAYLHYSLVVAS